jgi:dTDP-4-amino-4,6-dideoxygalactose transaminase
MLSPFAARVPGAFPFEAARVRPFYFARNAVFHGARLLGLAGREVLVPAYHHGVEVAALVAAGAVPRFVRVDARMDLDLEHLRSSIGPRTGAIYVIHYAGFPQPMPAIAAIAREAGLPVIEDVALGLLSCEGTRPLGSTGDLGIFCFYKTLPVPNGGALVVNANHLGDGPSAPAGAPLGSTLSHAASALLANAAFRLGAAGERLRAGVRAAARLVRGRGALRPVSTGTSTFDPAATGLGMSALSHAIARRVDHGAVIAARRRNFFLLLGRLRERAPAIFTELPAGVCPLFYPLVCDDKDRVRQRLGAAGIESIDFWRRGHAACPVDDFPEVKGLRARVLEIPVHQDLGPEDMAYVARAVKEALA